MLSYKPFWDFLDNNGIDVLDLCHDACISPGTLEKLNENKSVELSDIDRICEQLCCRIEDVVEVVDF